jgi:Holliday junction resolvase RusA-like endonuclease
MKIVVYGQPAPQGSKRFVGLRGGKGVMIESSKAVKPWREAVKHAALDVRADAPIDEAVVVRMVFTVAKPKSAPKKRITYPGTKPDLSKLVRATEDALTDAGVWKDDARVVEYERVAKVYPGEDPEALDTPGAVIVIRLRHDELFEALKDSFQRKTA